MSPQSLLWQRCNAMKKCLALFVAVIAVFSLLFVENSEAKSFGNIYIRSDGSVSPSNAPIQREGDVYRLLDDMYQSPIVLERNHMILDGSGFTLEGAGAQIALNITCSNVTVINLKVLNWGTGILGAYNNVTVQNCNVTSNSKGIAIYASNYRVIGNYIASNEWGIRVGGAENVVSGNHLVDNSVGIWLTSNKANTGNVISYNILETNLGVVIETDLDGGFSVHHNNFIVSSINTHIILTAVLATLGDESKVVMNPWDNSAEGNYWSDYTTKYPNAARIINTGIYDTPYVINVAPNLTDRYPLVQEVAVSEVILPSPYFTPTPTHSATTNTPTEIPLESPTPSLSASATPSSSIPPSPQTPTTGFPLEIYAVIGLTIIIVVTASALILRRRAASKT
jgi:parallel beta-helix repeat protein